MDASVSSEFIFETNERSILRVCTGKVCRYASEL